MTQATAFLVELASTAANITNRSSHINTAAQQVLDPVRQVKLTSQSVSQIGERGLDAVENTIQNNQQVNVWYDDLVGGLTELSQYSDQMKSVISLLHIISDETHLLALNAAIEAAGAGEYGSRFEVVAQEIRALSNRSLKASQDVAGLLLEVETGIRLAGQVVKNGKQATQVALEVAHQSGAVIHELAAVIRQNSQEVEKI